MESITGCRCERVPEGEFDESCELNEGWEVLCKKDGYVYIAYLPSKEDEVE